MTIDIATNMIINIIIGIIDVTTIAYLPIAHAYVPIAHCPLIA